MSRTEGFYLIVAGVVLVLYSGLLMLKVENMEAANSVSTPMPVLPFFGWSIVMFLFLVGGAGMQLIGFRRLFE